MKKTVLALMMGSVLGACEMKQPVPDLMATVHSVNLSEATKTGPEGVSVYELAGKRYLDLSGARPSREKIKKAIEILERCQTILLIPPDLRPPTPDPVPIQYFMIGPDGFHATPNLGEVIPTKNESYDALILPSRTMVVRQCGPRVDAITVGEANSGNCEIATCTRPPSYGRIYTDDLKGSLVRCSDKQWKRTASECKSIDSECPTEPPSLPNAWACHMLDQCSSNEPASDCRFSFN